MREVTDEALQRLYWACRSRKGFPGEPPDESHGPPSTTAILDALGLMRPSLEDLGAPEIPPKHINFVDTSLTRQPTQTTSASSATPPTQDEYLPSPSQSSFSIASVHSPRSGATITAAHTASTIPATPPEMDMSEQFLYAASSHSSSRSNSSSQGALYNHTDSLSNMTFDLDTYLDTSSCTMPPNLTQPAHQMHDPAKYDMPATAETPGSVYPRDRPSLPAIPSIDRYLTPWPGSLAATYNMGARNTSLAR